MQLVEAKTILAVSTGRKDGNVQNRLQRLGSNPPLYKVLTLGQEKENDFNSYFIKLTTDPVLKTYRCYDKGSLKHVQRLLDGHIVETSFRARSDLENYIYVFLKKKVSSWFAGLT